MGISFSDAILVPCVTRVVVIEGEGQEWHIKADDMAALRKGMRVDVVVPDFRQMNKRTYDVLLTYYPDEQTLYCDVQRGKDYLPFAPDTDCEAREMSLAAAFKAAAKDAGIKLIVGYGPISMRLAA